MTVPLPEAPAETTADAIAGTTSAVASAVSNVATETLHVLQSENASLREQVAARDTRITVLEMEISAASARIAEAEKTEITVLVEETPAETPAEELPPTAPEGEPVTEVNPGEKAEESASTQEKDEKPATRKPRRRMYGRS